MSAPGTGSPPSSSTRPVTMIRSPIAGEPVPALVVRSASSSDNSARAIPGPVVSESVWTIRTISFAGDRFTVER